jgi:hypothetical protein
MPVGHDTKQKVKIVMRTLKHFFRTEIPPVDDRIVIKKVMIDDPVKDKGTRNKKVQRIIQK